MSNDFYNATGAPATGSPGSSATVRAEFASVVAGFDKLPALTGNADKILVVNGSGTAVAASGQVLPAGTLVGTTDTQTLTGKTFNLASNTLVATSAQLAAAITNETGSGALVFATSPVLAGTPTAPTAAAGTNTTQLATTAHVFAERANTATLTNKTLTAPVINGFTGNTSIINIGSGQIYKDASGNVGLGTATPTVRLEVGRLGGPQAIANVTPITNILLTAGGGAAGSGAAVSMAGGIDSVVGFFFGDVDDGQMGSVQYSNASDVMTFRVNLNERMRIDSSGNVGIGTTSPTQRLEVNGTVKATTFSGSAASLTGLPLTTGVTGTLPVANGGTGSTSTTYCSLTTNVTGTLPVANGGTGVTTSTGSGAVVLATSPALAGTPTAPTAAAGTNTTQLATTAHVLAERTNTATLTNKTLTTPVIGTISNTGTLTLPTSTDTLVGRATTDTLTNKTLTTPVINGFSGSTAIVNIGSGQIYKDASGNVGIGTTSPGQKLSVAGSGNFSTANARVTAGNTSGTASDITMGADSGVGWIGSASNNVPIYFATNNTERMRIDTSGNVGVATTSPDALVTINGIASFGAGAVGTPSLARSGDLNTGIWFPASDTIAASVGGAEALRITSAGLLQFNSGYGSVATAFGCRAWVNFDGTLSSPISPRGSGNVSSVTKNGTGSYAVNLTTAMPDNNYAANVTVGFASAGTHIGEISSNGVSASILNIFTVGGSTVADFPIVTVAIFR